MKRKADSSERTGNSARDKACRKAQVLRTARNQINLGSLAVLLGLALTLSGCGGEEKTGVLKKEWTAAMGEHLHLSEDELSRWGVDEATPVQSELTRLAACQMLLQAWQGQNAELNYESCREAGLLSGSPGQPLTQSESEAALTRLEQLMNTAPDVMKIDFHRGASWLDVRPNTLDDKTLTGTFDEDAVLAPGMWFADEQSGQCYEIVNTEIGDNHQQAELRPVPIAEILEGADINASFTADLSQAEIQPLIKGQNLNLPELPALGSALPLRFQPVSFFRQQFEWHDYQISWSVSSAGVHAHISRKLANQAVFQMDFDLSDLKPTLRYKQQNGRLQEGRLQLSLNSTQSAGLTRGRYQTLRANPADWDGADLLNSVIQSFSTKRQSEETILPLASIRIPVPQMPVLDIVFQLELHWYANGKIELQLNEKGSAGVEIRNGVVRPFADFENRHDFIFQGSAAMSAAVRASGRAAGVSLLDIMAKAGLRGVVRTTAWVDDQQGTQKIETGEVPLDVLEGSLASDLPVRFCSDLNVHGILELSCNSEQTLAGRFGFGRELSLLNENNATLNPGGRTHLESGVFVERCTRSEKKSTAAPDLILKTDKIELEPLQIILDPGQSAVIQIKGLPEELTKKQLIWLTGDPSVATILQTGKVTAMHPGNTVITVRDENDQYQTQVHIAVREATACC